MTLDMLLYEIRRKYKEVLSELQPYNHIPEVESFLKRRGEDLAEFERVVRPYRRIELTGIVLNSLRERGQSYKILGICKKGAEYFEITKKVEKAIEDYENELIQMAYEQEVMRKEISMNSDYAIPDELSSEQLEEVFCKE